MKTIKRSEKISGSHIQSMSLMTNKGNITMTS